MKKKASRRPSREKRILLIGIGVLLLALVTALVLLIVKLAAPGQAVTPADAGAADDTHLSISDLVGDTVSDPPSSPAGEPASATTPSITPDAGGADAGATPSPAALTPAAKATLPKPDFAAITASGVPALGWLYCAGTAIDYPMVQYTENEYYMDHAADGKKSSSGAIFLDCRNSTELLDEQVMIYGNPMADGSMFGSLVNYKDQAYYAAHPSLYLLTGTQTYRIDVFAARTASPDISNYPTWFMDKTVRKQFIDYVTAQSLIKPSVTAGESDVLVSLVTCSDYDAGSNARFVVHGVLVKQ